MKQLLPKLTPSLFKVSALEAVQLLCSHRKLQLPLP